LLVVSLPAAVQAEHHLIGGKAMNLARMQQQGLPVPDGFVVTAHAFHRFLQENGIQHSWSDLQIRSAIIDGHMPETLISELFQHYASLQATSRFAVAVRSSSSFEDMASASFAGQYETRLNVNSFFQLVQSIKVCWASFFSPAVRQYAQRQAISMDSPAMAVLVQIMVRADVSGVLFSSNPVTGNPDEIVINASYGLGEPVVSGEVTPDMYIVGRKNGSISRHLGEKQVKYVTGGWRTLCLPVPPEEREVYCLTDEMIQHLVQLAKMVESCVHYDADLEFAFEQGRLYLLQVRPITA